MTTAIDMKMESQSSGENAVQNCGPMSPGPLFVVGMWRSGTSLLYALLNQHPQIGLMYESDFFLLTTLFSLPRRNGTWIAKLDSWNGALTRHKIDTASLPGDVADMPGAFCAVAQQYAKKRGATVWGCKSPNYYDCMNKLADWFVEAKFIVIWRDPADVCRSIMRAAESSPWFARPGTDLRALLGYRRMKQEADRLVRRGAAIHQLEYDDLVRDAMPALRAICDFIGVPYDSRMNTLEGADRSAIYDGAHHSLVNSAAIVRKREGPEVLSPQLRIKIERYVALWRKQYDGKWPVNAVMREGTDPATWRERAWDSLRLAFLRSRDAMIPAMYSFVPTAAWQKYRRVKARHQQAEARPRDGEVV